MRNKTVIISGGGTGGHLYPALAVGQKLKEKDSEINLIFVGSKHGVEEKIMKHYKAKFIPLKIEGIKGKGLKVIKSLAILPYAFLKSFVILLRNKPKLVIGMGGYSSGPIVLLASWMRIPTIILEQNVYPGFTNRVLFPRVKKAVTAFKNSLPYFKGKGVFIGNPVREEFYYLTHEKKNHYFTILIFGGSQGSYFLNQAVISSLPLLKEEKEALRIFHQTGEKDYEWVKAQYITNRFSDEGVAPYFHNMAELFQKADLLICRAGATTIAEIIAARKASILIPFAKAADNHQFYNAKELENIRGAELICEEEFTPAQLAGKILYFMKNRQEITRMEKNLEHLRTENAADRISNLCLELMKTQHKEDRTW